MPLFKDKFFVDDDLLRQFRQRFLDELNTSDKELYHPDDIQRVKDNDWFIGRYLLHVDSDLEKAIESMKESLIYRKEMEVNTLRKKDLPKEFFDVRAVILYNEDVRGYPVVAVRCKTHFKKEETRKAQQQYFLYWVEKALKISDWGVITVLFDCTDSGLSNMDLDMIRFILDVFRKYCPWGLSYFLVCNMPWYLSTFWKVIKQWIPEKYVAKIAFVDNDSVKKYINADQLPESLGGTSTKLYEPKEGAEDGDDSE